MSQPETTTAATLPGSGVALEPPAAFATRHIGPDPADTAAMLQVIGLGSLDELTARTVPAAIRLKQPLALPAPVSEEQALAELARKAAKNRVFRSFIGMGYHDCHTPAVILRNVLENPGWYTQYTPYQAEIAQGRLEALINFQTMVADLTGLPLANASLLDEATAAAEAMTLCRALAKPGRDGFFVAEDCHPQTIAVVRTRAEPLGIRVEIGPGRRDRLRRAAPVRRAPAVPGDRRRRARPGSARRARPRRGGARRRRHRPAGADAAWCRRARWAPTSHSARRSASACRWATAGRTRPSSPCARSTSATCPAGSSACRRTPRAARPTGCRCRPASSTSAATRPRATSARRRCCSRSWPRCTPSTTARRGSSGSRGASTRSRACSGSGCGGSASTRAAGRFSTRCACAPRPRPAARSSRARGTRASTCGPTRTARSAWRSTRRRCPARCQTLFEAFAGGAVPFTLEQLADGVERGRARAPRAHERLPRRTRSSTPTTPSTRCSAT